MKPKTISFMEKRLIEEAGGVVAPFPVETVAHIAHGPGNDDGVVEGNKESDKHLEPAREFPPAANAAEGEGAGSAVAVPQGILQDKTRNAGCEERTQLGDKEGAAAVLVGDVGESPNVAKAHGRADRGHNKH